jgi:hypothetical protein
VASGSEKGESVIIPLSTRSDKVGLGLVALMFLSFGVIGFLGDPQNWKFGLGMTVFGMAFVAWMGYVLSGAFDKSVSITDRHIDLLHRGSLVRRVAWSSVAKASQVFEGFNKRLLLQDRLGENIVEIPTQVLGRRTGELYAQVQAHLPPGAKFVLVRQRSKWSRGQYGLAAVGGLLAGTVCLLVSKHAVSGQIDLGFGATVWIALAGSVFIAVGIVAALGWAVYERRAAQPAEVSIAESMADSLLIALRRLESGQPMRLGVYRYPEKLRRFNLKREIRITWVAVGLIAALFATGAWGMGIPSALAKKPDPANLAMAAFFASMAFLFLWMAKLFVRQIVSLVSGLQDEIETDGTQLWVLRDGRRIEARLQGRVKFNTQMRDSSGLNGARVCLLVDGEARWYDPSSMVRAPLESPTS